LRLDEVEVALSSSLDRDIRRVDGSMWVAGAEKQSYLTA
jgi:hypothetical protein